MTAAEWVMTIDFAVPTHATIGQRFGSWQAAAEYAKATIQRFDYPGQAGRLAEYDPRRAGTDGGTLIVYSRAFVQMRVITKRPDGGGADTPAVTWEVFRDGTADTLSGHEAPPARDRLEQVAEALDARCGPRGADWALTLTVGAQSAWSAEIRVTPQPNSPGPDRSLVTYAAGGPDAADAAGEALTATLAWLDSVERPDA